MNAAHLDTMLFVVYYSRSGTGAARELFKLQGAVNQFAFAFTITNFKFSASFTIFTLPCGHFE